MRKKIRGARGVFQKRAHAPEHSYLTAGSDALHAATHHRYAGLENPLSTFFMTTAVAPASTVSLASQEC
jgi:hypothetical protein